MKWFYRKNILALFAIISADSASYVAGLPDSLSIPRYYVGIQTANNRYSVSYTGPSNSQNTVRLRPFLITLGVLVTPRWSMQSGYAYRGEHDKSPGYTKITSVGVISGFRESDNQVHAIPIQARYRLTRKPVHKLQFDLLLGLTGVMAAYSFQTEESLNGILIQQGSDKGKAFQTYAVGGLGARYQFKRRFEVVWDLTLSRNLKPVSESVRWQTTGNRWGITRAGNFGVRYRFDIHSKTD